LKSKELKMSRTSISIVLVLVALVACDRTRSSTGWDYMPDMYYSNAYESYTPNPNFEDNLTMRTPVEGTVPREMLPFAWEKTDEDRIAAGEALVNPLEITAENIEEGKELYGIFCLSCHGSRGDGQGHLYTSERYPYPPANLVDDVVKELKDVTSHLLSQIQAGDLVIVFSAGDATQVSAGILAGLKEKETAR